MKLMYEGLTIIITETPILLNVLGTYVLHGLISRTLRETTAHCVQQNILEFAQILVIHGMEIWLQKINSVHKKKERKKKKKTAVASLFLDRKQYSFLQNTKCNSLTREVEIASKKEKKRKHQYNQLLFFLHLPKFEITTHSNYISFLFFSSFLPEVLESNLYSS